MVSNGDGVWFELYYHWGVMFSQLGVWADCLPPRPQGIIELALSHALLGHPVLPLEAQASFTHLGDEREGK